MTRYALRPFINKARIPRRQRRTRAAVKSQGTAAIIRDWAISQGHTLTDRGRIPLDVRAAYEQAHQDQESA